MSRRLVSSIGWSVLGSALVAAALQGCGGGSGTSSGGTESGDYASLCMQGCSKSIACEADAGLVYITMSACEQDCTAQAQTVTSCTNQSAIVSAFSACLKDTDCATFEACVMGAPHCQVGGGGSTGAGAGGTTGGAGSTGAGGASAPAGGTSGGSAGTHGTGGTTTAGGSAGSGASATCADCDNIGPCCAALAALEGIPSSGCSVYTSAMCSASPVSGDIAQVCQTFRKQGVLESVSACQ